MHVILYTCTFDLLYNVREFVYMCASAYNIHVMYKSTT